MAVTGDFLAIGTQLKIEKPTKGCIVTTCDSIDGPIVKLKNGSVKHLQEAEKVKAIYSDIEEIIYFGDILFPFSDLANRNYELIKPGYVEEWWKLELKERAGEGAGLFNEWDIDFETAVEVSNRYSIPLHPKFIFYWSQISKEELFSLLEWLKIARFAEKIILPYGLAEQEKYEKGKRALELLGLEHNVTIENVVIEKVASKALLLNLGADYKILEKDSDNKNVEIRDFDFEKNVLEIINFLSPLVIKDKAGDFIGTRMGRPEKAKLRKLTGSPHVLFPVSEDGGRLRSVQAACEIGKISSNFPTFNCKTCNKEIIYQICEDCGNKADKNFYCSSCENFFDSKICNKSQEHGDAKSFYYRDVDINYYLNLALKKLGLLRQEAPPLIKGIRGTSSSNHINENLAKGVLRANFGLQVNKDGTIRYDATETPITYFKPKEALVSVEKLKSIGYSVDAYGNELSDENQILELKPHDFLLPACPDSPDEKGDDVFIKIACFVDALLEKFYGLKSFYNLKKKEDLVGQLCVSMAPHNCAGVVCRIVGFTKSQGLAASPYLHAAMRRDCDGDEAAVMLLLDVLLNFSKEFLPSHRGGTQDAPLVLNAKIDAGEVDDQILDLEIMGDSNNICNSYPLKLYQLAEQRKHSSEVDFIYDVKKALREGKSPFLNIGYTHETSDINKGVLCSAYKKLATMGEKVQHQMELVSKLRSVDTSDVARLIIEQHFIRDIKGNLGKFSRQQFRCVSCNEKFRRPPLIGKCNRCGGKIIFTISEGGIVKYLEPALALAEKYDLSPYIKQSLELTKRYIESVFGRETEKQESLKDWF